jgi:hypothetical protein
MPSITVVFLSPSNVDDELRALCEDYWRRDQENLRWATAVLDLAGKYGVASQVISRVARETCYAIDPEIGCPGCKTPRRYDVRTDYDQRRGRQAYLCEDCHRRALEDEQKRKHRAEEERQASIRLFLGDPGELPPLDQISLEQAVYLLSVVRANASERIDFIQALENASAPLAPTAKFGGAMLSHLYQSRLLFIDPASRAGAFDWEGDRPATYRPYQVNWRVGVSASAAADILAAIEAKFRDRDWNPGWQDEISELWKTIIREEATQYLLFCLNDHQLDFSPGEKTLMTLSSALETYSLSRVWGVIWRAAKDAAAYHLRGAPRYQAANSVISRIQSYYERASAQKWELRPYRRDWRAPQSMVSQVFFNLVMKLPSYEDQMPSGEDLGRSEPPTGTDVESAESI